MLPHRTRLVDAPWPEVGGPSAGDVNDRQVRGGTAHLLSWADSLPVTGSSVHTRGMQRISLVALARQEIDGARRAGGGHTADTGLDRLKNALRSRVIGMLKERQWGPTWLSASSFVA